MFRTVRHWGRLNRLVRTIRAGPFAHWAARSNLPLSVSVRKGLGLAGADRVSGDFHRAFRTLFSSGQIQRLSNGALDGMPEGESHPGWFDSGNDHRDMAFSTVSAVSQMELDGYLRNTLLRDSDAMSMAHGLEVRAPFLDHHLVAAAASVYGHDKIAGERNKPLLAAAVSELPDLVTRRRKTGFRLPFDAWLRGPLCGWAAGSVEVGADGLSSAESRRIWKLFLGRSRTVSWSRAWALVVLASWLRRNQVTVG